MSSKKGSTPTGNPDITPPTPIKARKSRTPKNPQPAWYKATLDGGAYRIIEDDSAEAVAARIVTVTPATPQDFAQAGKDGVTLESKPPVVTAD